MPLESFPESFPAPPHRHRVCARDERADETADVGALALDVTLGAPREEVRRHRLETVRTATRSTPAPLQAPGTPVAPVARMRTSCWHRSLAVSISHVPDPAAAANGAHGALAATRGADPACKAAASFTPPFTPHEVGFFHKIFFADLPVDSLWPYEAFPGD